MYQGQDFQMQPDVAFAAMPPAQPYEQVPAVTLPGPPPPWSPCAAALFDEIPTPPQGPPREAPADVPVGRPVSILAELLPDIVAARRHTGAVPVDASLSKVTPEDAEEAKRRPLGRRGRMGPRASARGA